MVSYSGRLNCIYLFAGFLTFSSIAVITQAAPIVTIDNAMIYLSKYGYLPPLTRNRGNAAMLDARTWHKAVQDFQRFAGLDVSGDLDSETKQLMSLPRCGVRDKVGSGSGGRSKRYLLQGSKWDVHNLTYTINKFPKNLQPDEVRAEIARAFAAWSKHSNLTFTEKEADDTKEAAKDNIKISFEEDDHGDEDPFDGEGATLAHAFYPEFGGETHFDGAEFWTIGALEGTNIFQVAVHEFGHSLGLIHSDVRTALMAPFYHGFDPFFELDSDDVLAIQALYGKPASAAAPLTGANTSAVVVQARDDNICQNLKVDAAFNSAADGAVYALKGNKYYKLTAHGIADGYPKLIAEGWPGLPGHIDAAFTTQNNETYFFKGAQHWRYTGRHLEGGYPRKIGKGFKGIPNSLDAAVAINHRIYFYKGRYVWNFDPVSQSAKPYPISRNGLPSNLDAVLHANGLIYFFKDDKYYVLTDLDSAQALPAQPRSVGGLFGCEHNSSTHVFKKWRPL